MCVCMYTQHTHTHTIHTHADTKFRNVRTRPANNDPIWLERKGDAGMLQGAESYHTVFQSKYFKIRYGLELHL